MISISSFWLYLILIAIFALLFIALPFKRSDKRQKKIACFLAMALLFGSFSLYVYWGNSQSLIHVRAYQTISLCLDELSKQENLKLEQVLARLKQLEKEVNYSHEGLARLGTIYSELGHYEEGSKMIEQAMSLAPTRREYAMQWIYHQSFLNQGKLPLNVRKKAETLLLHPSTKQAAMNMLAMDDYFQENYASAISHWETILDTDESLTTERREVLERAIANAKARSQS